MPTADPLSRAERLALAAGLAFVVLQVATMALFATSILPALGPVDAPPAARAAAYAAHGDAVRLGNYLLTLPTPLFLFFLGGLAAVAGRAEGAGRVLTLTGVVAGAAMAMLWPLAAVLNDLAIDIARHGGDAATVSALDAVGPYTLALSALPRVVLVGAVSAVVLQHGLAARWVGWLGLAVVALSLPGTGVLLTPSLFGPLALSTLLFEGWIVALCATLLRARPRGPAAGPSPVNG
jgi:hypothetical protein